MMAGTIRGTVFVVLLVAIGPAGGARADLIFHNFTPPGHISSRTAGSSPGAKIRVAVDTPITNIAVQNQLSADGNLKFLVFDRPTTTLLFASAAQPFAATPSQTYKMSESFSFTLLAGHTY